MFIKRFSYSLLCKSHEGISSAAYFSTSPTFKEQKIKIRNYEINYLIVDGGPHHVFCAPGSFGTIWNDFGKQIEGFNRDKFSLVVWDPPGFGKSLALDNKQSLEVFYNQPDIAYEFMKALQIPKYSLMGWSSGSGACYLLAGKYPDVVNKLVLWGCCAFISPREIKFYKNLKNLNNWPKATKEALIKMYGEENFKIKIDKVVDPMVEIYDSKTNLIEEIKRVRCPTLILHGAKDPVVESQHLKHLQNLITNSRSYLYPEGGHNIHVQYADDFNKRVQEFLLQPN